MALVTTSNARIEWITDENARICERITSYRNSLQSLQEANQTVREKIRYMKKKMMKDDHRIMQVGFYIKDQEKELSIEREKLRVKEEQLSKQQTLFEKVQDRRRLVQNKIREEIYLMKEEKQITERDFFAVDAGSKTKADARAFEMNVKYQVTNEVELLQKKILEKERLVEAISPVVEHMNGKFCFSLTKRKQRKQLRCVHKKLVNDIAFLQKTIDFLK